MNNALPFVARPARSISVPLTDDMLDRIDVIRTLTGMPPRAAFLRELIELGLELYENPTAAVTNLVEGLEAIYAAAETDAVRAGPLDLRNPS